MLARASQSLNMSNLCKTRASIIFITLFSLQKYPRVRIQLLRRAKDQFSQARISVVENELSRKWISATRSTGKLPIVQKPQYCTERLVAWMSLPKCKPAMPRISDSSPGSVFNKIANKIRK